MAFTVLAFSQLIHLFNIRNNKESIFKTGIFNNPQLIWATIISAIMMFVILWIPPLRTIFSIAELPVDHVFEVILLVFSPILIVELMKCFKWNTSKDEE